MRELILVIGVTLTCAGCVTQPPPPMFSRVASQVAPDNPNCREYSARATVDGKPREIVGRACRQDDGTWRIAEGSPGQPASLVTVYAPPPYGAWYPSYDPWLWGWPIGLSLGPSVVFVDRDHRFHHFRFADGHHAFGSTHFHGGFGGFRGGFGHGGGMRHG
jgi:hypothetical protein